MRMHNTAVSPAFKKSQSLALPLPLDFDTALQTLTALAALLLSKGYPKFWTQVSGFPTCNLVT